MKHALKSVTFSLLRILNCVKYSCILGRKGDHKRDLIHRNVNSSIFKQWAGSLSEERNGIVLSTFKVSNNYSYFDSCSLLSNSKSWALGKVTSGQLRHLTRIREECARKVSAMEDV